MAHAYVLGMQCDDVSACDQITRLSFALITLSWKLISMPWTDIKFVPNIIGEIKFVQTKTLCLTFKLPILIGKLRVADSVICSHEANCTSDVLIGSLHNSLLIKDIRVHEDIYI